MRDPALKPCPRCGRVPKLREYFKHASDPPWTSFSLVGFQFYCRRWFGLRACTEGAIAWNEKGWGDIARLRAIHRWNALSDPQGNVVA